MHILIPGGTGLVGTALAAWLVQHNHTVTILSRSPRQASAAGIEVAGWDGKSERDIVECVNRADAIVNLAGANLADKRWTAQYKQVIRQSRTDTVATLVRAIEVAERKPDTFVQASAVGFYGSSYSSETLTENLPAGTDFLATVCQDWESGCTSLESLGIRLTVARLGIVLDRGGGALARMLPPFQMGLGGALGDGKQPFPWIHLQDAASALAFLATHENTLGAYNVTSPNIISNREFSQHLAHTLRKPLLLDVPAMAIQLLFGELSVLLLHGQNAVSRKLQAAGFEFQYTEAQAALAELFG